MSNHSLSHLANPVLRQNTLTLSARDRTTTATLLAHLAEIDLRRLYRAEGYPSMFQWCVGVLRFSEDSAGRRIQAARLARLHPVLLAMLEDGRTSLSAIGLLSEHLKTPAGAELLTAAAGMTNQQIARLLAERFPKADLPSALKPLGDGPTAGSAEAPGLALETTSPSCQKPAALRMESRKSLGRTAPLSPGRFALTVTISAGTHEKLRYAQALLGHAVPSGDLAQVLDRALDALVTKLEQRKFGAGARLQPNRRRGVRDDRHIPAAVRRTVWERDGGRCTFVSDQGHRCEATSRLEFDHEQPFARGGQATPSQLRLRCQAHNQYAAEQVYGAEFMRHR